MVNYILRRMVLMVPTLIGITFLVFLLIAMSPGGVGAGLQVQAGGTTQSQSSVSVQRAKLEDRYGLNDSVIVQYGRWLSRISPVRFGQRDLISPSGVLVVAPRAIPEPAVWSWLAERLPTIDGGLRATTTSTLAAMDAERRALAFRDLERQYVEARAAYTSADAYVRDALVRYVDVADARREAANAKGDAVVAEALRPWSRDALVSGGIKPRIDRLIELKPDRATPEFAEIERLGKVAIDAWAKAAAAREAMLGGMASAPYPASGIGIGPMSLSWPDLGYSFSTNQPVIEMIKRHLPVTLLLNIVAIPLIYFIAIPSGMLAAVRKGGLFDVGLGSLYIGLYSIPVVLAGVLMLGFLANPDYGNAFPTAGLHDKDASEMAFLPHTDASGVQHLGYLFDMLWHMVLPVACLVYAGFAVLSKQTRAAMLENMSADYVRTAKAKGVAPRDVILKHVFRNSLLPLITMFVSVFPAMLAGSVVIERIFSVQGMGWLVIESIQLRDREMILANTTMIAVVNMVALLLADILYAAADPRITYK